MDRSKSSKGAVSRRHLDTTDRRSSAHKAGSVVGSREHLEGADVSNYVGATAKQLPPVAFRDQESLQRYAQTASNAREVKGGGYEIDGVLYMPPSQQNYRATLKGVTGQSGEGYDADHALARSRAIPENIGFVQVGWSPPSVNRAIGSRHERGGGDLGLEENGVIYHDPTSYMKSTGTASGTQFAFEAAFAYVAPPEPPEEPSPLHQRRQAKYRGKG